HEVGVMDNLSTGREENVNPAAQLYRVDITDRAQVQTAMASFEPHVVNHHAAQSEVPKSVADPGYDALVNVVGGLNVLRACVDGDGNQSRDMLHVGDVAMANITALEHGDGGTFHISSGIPVTVNDLFRKIALLTDYKLAPMHGPARKGDVYRIALDNRRAAELLGWQPRIQLEEGLRLTVDYFRDHISRLHA